MAKGSSDIVNMLRYEGGDVIALCIYRLYRVMIKRDNYYTPINNLER